MDVDVDPMRWNDHIMTWEGTDFFKLWLRLHSLSFFGEAELNLSRCHVTRALSASTETEQQLQDKLHTHRDEMNEWSMEYLLGKSPSHLQSSQHNTTKIHNNNGKVWVGRVIIAKSYK